MLPRCNFANEDTARRITAARQCRGHPAACFLAQRLPL